MSNALEKLVSVEFSQNVNEPNIAIIGSIQNEKKILNLYKVDREKYEPKLKLKEVSRNREDLEELRENSELVCKLIFNHDESIESLISILSELYNLGKIEGQVQE